MLRWKVGTRSLLVCSEKAVKVVQDALRFSLNENCILAQLLLKQFGMHSGLYIWDIGVQIQSLLFL